MSPHNRIRILLPVWGDHYLRLATELCVPSLLSPGNIPALAEHAACEFVFLTRESSVPLISEMACCRALRTLGAVTFTPIDDLIVPGLPDLTLTYAFARGIHDTGADMTNIRFVFVNADFVFSDGAVRFLIPHLDAAGASAILAPSLRCVSEEVTAKLLADVDQEHGCLSVQSRPLVGLALDHLHPTALASTVNQDFVHNVAFNQFLWRVDEHTLVGRFHLLFMLSIKPERVMTDVPGFCDYTFVGEMCPSGRVAILDDSDLGFIIELQRREAELQYLRFGRPTPAHVAEKLAEWTTELHRRNAAHTILFHARAIPPAADAITDEAHLFINVLERLLPRNPVPYRRHPYWRIIAAAAPYVHRRPASDARVAFPEVRAGAIPVPPISIRLTKSLYTGLSGTPPWVTILHYDWQDYRHLAPLLKDVTEHRHARMLIVAENLNLILEMQKRLHGRADQLSPAQLEASQHGERSPYAFVFCYLNQQHIPATRDVIRRAVQMLEPGGRLVVMLHDMSASPLDVPLARTIFANALEIVPFEFVTEKVVVNNGEARIWMRRLILQCATRIHLKGLKRAFGPAIALLPLFFMMFLLNVAASVSRKHPRGSPTCSSLLFTIRRLQINTSRRRELLGA